MPSAHSDLDEVVKMVAALGAKVEAICQALQKAGIQVPEAGAPDGDEGGQAPPGGPQGPGPGGRPY